MSPDRLRAWIKKRKPGAARLVLDHEQGLGVRSTVASWTREEIETAEDPTQGASDVVAAIFDAGQDHTNGLNQGTRARVTFLLSWQAEQSPTSAGRILNSTPLYFIAAEDVAEQNANASETLTPMQLIRELLGHIHEQQKVMNGAVGSIVNGSRTTIEGLQAHSNLQSTQILALLQERQQLQLLKQSSAEPSPIDLEWKQTQTEAIKKAIEFFPIILQTGLAALAHHYGWNVPPAGTNGAGKSEPKSDPH